MAHQITITWRWEDDDTDLPMDARKLIEWLRDDAPVPDKIVGVNWHVAALSMRNEDGRTTVYSTSNQSIQRNNTL